MQKNKWEKIKRATEIIQCIAVIIGIYLTVTALQDTRKIESAKFVLQVDDNFNQERYKRIINAVEGEGDNPHGSNYPILTKGVTSREIDDYLAVFNNIGLLLDEGLINENMAYTTFSYDSEKAYCNKNIWNYVMAERKASGALSGDNAFYGYAEDLALNFMKIDNYKNCSDLDAHDGAASAKE